MPGEIGNDELRISLVRVKGKNDEFKKIVKETEAFYDQIENNPVEIGIEGFKDIVTNLQKIRKEYDSIDSATDTATRNQIDFAQKLVQTLDRAEDKFNNIGVMFKDVNKNTRHYVTGLDKITRYFGDSSFGVQFLDVEGIYKDNYQRVQKSLDELKTIGFNHKWNNGRQLLDKGDYNVSELRQAIDLLYQLREAQDGLREIDTTITDSRDYPSGFGYSELSSIIDRREDELWRMQQINLSTTKELALHDDLIDEHARYTEDHWQAFEQEDAKNAYNNDREIYQNALDELQKYIDNREKLLLNLRKNQHLFNNDELFDASSMIDEAEQQLNYFQTQRKELVEYGESKNNPIGDPTAIVEGLTKVEEAIKEITKALEPMTEAFKTPGTALQKMTEDGAASLDTLLEKIQKVEGEVRDMNVSVSRIAMDTLSIVDSMHPVVSPTTTDESTKIETEKVVKAVQSLRNRIEPELKAIQEQIDAIFNFNNITPNYQAIQDITQKVYNEFVELQKKIKKLDFRVGGTQKKTKKTKTTTDQTDAGTSDIAQNIKAVEIQVDSVLGQIQALRAQIETELQRIHTQIKDTFDLSAINLKDAHIVIRLDQIYAQFVELRDKIKALDFTISSKKGRPAKNQELKTLEAEFNAVKERIEQSLSQLRTRMEQTFDLSQVDMQPTAITGVLNNIYFQFVELQEKIGQLDFRIPIDPTLFEPVKEKTVETQIPHNKAFGEMLSDLNIIGDDAITLQKQFGDLVDATVALGNGLDIDAHSIAVQFNTIVESIMRLGTVTEETTNQYKEFYDRMKGTTISYTDEDKAEFGDAWAATRKRFNNVLTPYANRHKTGAIGADVLYAELSGLFGELFPEDVVNPHEQLMLILDTLGKARDARRAGKTVIKALPSAYKEDIANQLDNVWNSALQSAPAISEEARAMDKVATSAEDAAKAKEKFTEVNKEAAQSGLETDSSISKAADAIAAEGSAAEEAAKQKEKLTEANKEVADSFDKAGEAARASANASQTKQTTPHDAATTVKEIEELYQWYAKLPQQMQYSVSFYNLFGEMCNKIATDGMTAAEAIEKLNEAMRSTPNIAASRNDSSKLLHGRTFDTSDLNVFTSQMDEFANEMARNKGLRLESASAELDPTTYEIAGAQLKMVNDELGLTVVETYSLDKATEEAEEATNALFLARVKVSQREVDNQKDLTKSIALLSGYENQIKSMRSGYEAQFNPTKPITDKADLDELNTKLQEITNKIQGFKDESGQIVSVVSPTAKAEIEALLAEYNLLIKKLQNKTWVASSLRTKDASTLNAEFSQDLETFKNQLQSANLTDAMRGEIRALEDSLKTAFDKDSLTKWMNQFDLAKKKMQTLQAAAKAKKADTTFGLEMENQLSALIKQEAQWKANGQLTEELSFQLELMFEALSKVTDTASLTAWRKQWSILKNEVAATKYEIQAAQKAQKAKEDERAQSGKYWDSVFKDSVKGLITPEKRPELEQLKASMLQRAKEEQNLADEEARLTKESVMEQYEAIMSIVTEKNNAFKQLMSAKGPAEQEYWQKQYSAWYGAWQGVNENDAVNSFFADVSNQAIIGANNVNKFNQALEESIRLEAQQKDLQAKQKQTAENKAIAEENKQLRDQEREYDKLIVLQDRLYKLKKQQIGVDGTSANGQELQRRVDEAQQEYDLYLGRISVAENYYAIKKREATLDDEVKTAQEEYDWNQRNLAIKEEELAVERQIAQEVKAYDAALKQQQNYGKSQYNTETRNYNKIMAGVDEIEKSSDAGLSDKFKTQLEEYKVLYKELTDLREQFNNDPNAAKNPALVEQFQKVTLQAENARKGIQSVLKESAKIQQISEENILATSTLDVTKFSKAQEGMEAFARSTLDGTFRLTGFNKAGTEMHGTLTKANGAVEKVTVALDETNNTMTAFRTGTKVITNEWKRLTESVGRGIKQIATMYLSFYDIIRYMRQGVTYVKEIDTALTELKKVTDETSESYERFLNQMSRTASEVGTTVKDLTTSAADWARLKI